MKDEEKPQAPSRPPWHSTSHRLTFRPVKLRPRVEASSSASTKKPRKQRATATSATEPVYPVDVEGTEVGAAQESVRGESDIVAGPSQPRQSGSPDRADAPLAGAHLTHSSRKPLKKVPINTMEQLLAIDLETVAPQIRCKSNSPPPLRLPLFRHHSPPCDSATRKNGRLISSLAFR